jgi:hypothetical protein
MEGRFQNFMSRVFSSPRYTNNSQLEKDFESAIKNKKTNELATNNSRRRHVGGERKQRT